ncbi:MAG: transposase, partial [Clostridia bacterium]|nr:transposase [Clostridia bacterium]
DYKLWQEGVDCQEIFLYDYLQQKLNYIHNNPVKEEFVNLPEEYKYSSAIDYASGKGILKVEVIK